MCFRYLVQLADEFGFDFGGVNTGGVAQFVAKGDAVLFAQELRRRAARCARVIDTQARKRDVVFFCAPTAEQAGA